MKRLSCLLLACLLAVPAAARGELKVSFVNRTTTDILNIGVYGKGKEDEGSCAARMTMRVVPGNEGTLVFGNASEMAGVVLDMGLRRFVFNDCKAFEGKEDLKLELTLAKNGRPLLAAPGAAPSDAETEFALEAGPLAGQEHAQERCPEVLRTWLAAHPGERAVWSGGWWTTIPDEMSVCAVKRMRAFEAAQPEVRDEAQAASLCPNALKAWLAAHPGSEARWTGAWTPGSCLLERPLAEALLDDFAGAVGEQMPLVSGNPDPADFAAVRDAKNMAALRAFGADILSPQAGFRADRNLWLPIRIGATDWVACVQPADVSSFSYDEAEIGPGNLSLRAAMSSEAADGLFEFFRRAGYRPWSLQVNQGSEMDMDLAVGFPGERPDREEALNYAREQVDLMLGVTSPVTVKTLFIPDAAYERAAKGEDVETDGFMVSFGNSDVLLVEYFRSAGIFVSLSR